MTLDKILTGLLEKHQGLVILITLVLIIAVVFLVYKSFNKEEGFGNFYDQQTKYTSEQRAQYWDNMNLQVDYNEDLEKDIKTGLTDAIKSIDPLTNKTKKYNIDSFFRKDPLPGIKKADQQCSSATEPLLLTPHGKNESSGCGWWYIDDDFTQSYGARGTELGPFGDLSKVNPSGKWIWNLSVAQKMEDKKKCRRIKTCDMADLLAEKCGFCTTLSMGLPAGPNGSIKYPDDPNSTCPENLIMVPGNCPKIIPTPKPVTLSDGTVIIPAPAPELCDPVNGKLSTDCLISLAKGSGCSEDGAIVSILSGDSKGLLGPPGSDVVFKYTKAVEILKNEASLVIQPAFLGNGVCDRSDALNFYQQLVTLILRGKTTRAREASAFLAIGTDFDPCDYDLDQNGAFDMYCLERVAKEAGCQPDGSDYPKIEANKRRYDRMTWQTVGDYFKTIHRNLLSPDQNVLADATKRCLGVDIIPKVSDCGEKSGVEVLWYSWDYEWDMPERPTSAQIFYGREIKSNLPNFNTGGGDYNPYGVQNRMSFRSRTNVFSKTQKATRFWVMTDDGVAIKANDKLILSNWRDQGPTAYETSAFLLSENAFTKLDFYWYQNYGGSTFLPKISVPDNLTTFQPILGADLTMNVPDTFPLCRWDFYITNMDERNNILTSNPENITNGVIDGKKCAILGKNAGISIVNQIMGSAFKSFVFMTYHRGGWARLFALRSGSCDRANWNGWAIEGGICSDSRVWFCFQRKGGDKDIWVSTKPNTIPLNKWIHLAYCIDDDFKGVTIYCDMKIIARARNDAMNSEDYISNKYNIATIGHAGWNCSNTIIPPPSGDAPVKRPPPIVGPPECKGLGRPSADNGRLRVYTQSECETSLNGNFSGNGECGKKEGGSYSWDCRELNTTNKIKIVEASYGRNCSEALRGNRNDLFKKLADGQDTLKYTFNYTTTGGDPAGGCAKTLEIDYTCGEEKRGFKAPPEAGYSANVDIGCSQQYATQSYAPPVPPDCPQSEDGSLNIGLAWVHWFDYTLSQKDIQNDRILAFTDETVYVEDDKSGWKKGKTDTKK